MKIINRDNNTLTYQYESSEERNNHLNSGTMKDFIITKICGGLNNEPMLVTFKKVPNEN